MSRHGYTDDDIDPNDLALWRASVQRSIQGKRGQQALRDLLTALDAMPEKRLIRSVFRNRNGECCSLGVLAEHRGVSDEMPAIASHEMSEVEIHNALCPFDDSDVIREEAAAALDIAPCLAAEIMYENDWKDSETPEERWARMRRWVEKRIRQEEAKR